MSYLRLKSICFEDSEGNTITIDSPGPIDFEDLFDNTKTSAYFYTAAIIGASIARLAEFVKQEKEEQA